MRITNQMIARTAAKSGISLQQNTLLNILNKSQSPSQTLFPSVSNKKGTKDFWQNMNNTDSKQLAAAAGSLSAYASKLQASGENSLFEKAEKTGDSSELTEQIIGMADAYNKTLKHLKGSKSTLDMFYRQELKGYAADHADALRKVGVSVNADGSIKIQQDVLASASIESLKAAFGSASGFMEKVGYVSGRVAENAAASSASILNGYDRTGKEYMDAFRKGMYDFWG